MRGGNITKESKANEIERTLNEIESFAKQYNIKLNRNTSHYISKDLPPVGNLSLVRSASLAFGDFEIVIGFMDKDSQVKVPFEKSSWKYMVFRNLYDGGASWCPTTEGHKKHLIIASSRDDHTGCHYSDTVLGSEQIVTFTHISNLTNSLRTPELNKHIFLKECEDKENI